MKKIFKFLLLPLIVIAIIIPLMYSSHGAETVFIISEFDFPIEWSHGEVGVAEITGEELIQYPILQNLINDDCTKYGENWWRCNVNPEEWNRIKNFIYAKENADTCIKVGEKCYRIDFVTCCTKNVEITDISLWRCACLPDMEMYQPQEDGENNEIGLNLEIKIQNNQSLGTDLLTYKINIKNSSNVIISNYSSNMPFYIKSNSSIGSTMTTSFPGPGEYNIDVQVLENDKIIARRSINKTIEAYSNVGNNSPIISEEYEVYSAVIQLEHDSKTTFSESINKFVIRGLTHNETYEGQWDSYINNFENYTMKKLEPGLVNDFKIKKSNISRLENKFSIPQRIIIISEKELDETFRDMDGWDRFYEIYPNSSGVIEVSRAGFNNNYTQALIYYGEQSHYVAGHGYLVFLIKEEDNWTIKEQVLLWVS